MFKFLTALFKKKQKECCKTEIVEVTEKSEEQIEKVEKVEIAVKGDYSLEVIDKENEPYAYCYDKYFIKLKYKVNVKLRENYFNLDSYFIVSNHRNEEQAYLHILKLLENGEEKLLKEIKESIIYKLRVAIKDQNIKEMKKILEDKNNFKLNFTFEAEKSIFDKNTKI